MLAFPEQSLGSVGDLIDAGGRWRGGQKISNNILEMSNFVPFYKGRFPHGLPEPAVALIVRDVLLALQYLHEKVRVQSQFSHSIIPMQDKVGSTFKVGKFFVIKSFIVCTFYVCTNQND